MFRRRLIITLLATAVAAPALAGQMDFTVASDDTTFRLANARGKFVALHFLFKTECPFCQRHVAEMARRAPEAAGLVNVFLKPDSEEEVKNWSAKLKAAGIDATIYRDADAALAQEFKIPDGYPFHGQTVRYPALVLLGPDGKEVFRHVGKNNRDRVSFETLAAKVAEHSKNTSVEQYNLPEDRLAIKGYDPVAYFDGGKPEMGKVEMISKYGGVTYRFASAQRRRQFAANPDKYVPAYGGWCATAMAEGRKVEVDPTNFKVTGGRLFLFYKGWLGNAVNDWNKDEKKLTVSADQQWRGIAPGDAKEGK